MPQLPQLLVSVCVSTQPPLHSVWPVAQPPVMQLPAEHTWPTGHAVPQVPQLKASLCVSIHETPHSASGAQSAAQPAGRQNGVAPPQTTPGVPVAASGQLGLQPPQWLASPWVLTHWPQHSVRPAPQPVEQLPLEQRVPGVHTLPHAPQLSGSLTMLVQPPLHSWGELLWTSHPVEQVPLLQIGVSAGQLLSHAAQ